MRHAEEVTFGGSGLDRAAELRGDAEKQRQLQADPVSRAILFWRSKPLFSEGEAVNVPRFPLDHPVVQSSKSDLIFLGMEEEGAVFACDISSWQPADLDAEMMRAFFDPSIQRHPDLPADYGFAELRGVMTRVSVRDAELAAMGKSILSWQRSHRFCAQCGAESEMVMAGWQRDCPSCGAHHFPRTDPVVIMLITHGNKVLMGRSHSWPEGMYSLLAGFVEPGETMEAAVRREVVEEAGIRVGAVEYLSSQPWPYPSSLMFGCRGEALNDDITVDPNELEDAIWVSREEIMASFAGQHPFLKPARKGAIAHFILRNWLADRLD